MREKNEWDVGHIPGAIHIPLAGLESKAEETVSDKDGLVVVYCDSGGRSGPCAETLKKIGYTNVRDLGDGMIFCKIKE